MNTESAAFAALYAAPNGSGNRAASDVTLITRAPGCSAHRGQRELDQPDRRERQRLELRAQFLRRQFHAGAEPAAAGVVDQHVEPARRFPLRAENLLPSSAYR